MLPRIALLSIGLLMTGRAVAADNLLSGPGLCHQSMTLSRELWTQKLFDTSPDVAQLMIDAIDGKLPQVRRELAAMMPADAARWRQTAMITASASGQPAEVEGLLADGAEVNGMAWMPPMKDSLYHRTLHDMKRDPRFGGPKAVQGMQAMGLVSNRGWQTGPALIEALGCDNVATLDVLLRHHANINWRMTPHSADALTMATVNGDAEIVQRLLDHGADPCADDRLIQSHKPGASLATIGQHNGLPESQIQRLSCHALATMH